MASASIHSASNGEGLGHDIKDEKVEKLDESKPETAPPGPPKKNIFQRLDLDVITVVLMVK
jgi:hypothetical protein